MKIYKYVIGNSPEIIGGKSIFKVEMPVNAIVLDCQIQGSNVCIWAMVDPNEELIEHIYIAIGTGWEIPELQDAELKFIKTIQVSDGLFVYHIFEILKTVKYASPIIKNAEN